MRGGHDADDARVEQMMDDDERQYKWVMGNWGVGRAHDLRGGDGRSWPHAGARWCAC